MTCFLTPDDELVVNLANELNDPEKMYYYVRDRITYLPEQHVDMWNTSRTTILNGMGDCDDQAILLSSLLWSKGFKNRIVLDHLVDQDIGHMFVELFDTKGQIIRLDPTCTKCNFGFFPEINEEVIGYVYLDKTLVVNPRLYKLYVGNRFNFKYKLGCDKVECHCKGHCKIFENCDSCGTNNHTKSISSLNIIK